MIILQCDLYRSNQIDGNLCHSLCNDSSLQFFRCLHVGSTDKVVLEMFWNETKRVVMKTKYHDTKNYFSFNYQPISKDNPLSRLSSDVFKLKIMELFRFHLGFKINGSSLIGSLNFLDWSESEQVQKYMSSVWLLLQQDEYFQMNYFKTSSFIPESYGSCGHYYFIEYLPPGKHLISGNIIHLFSFLFQYKASWLESVETAIQLLDAMEAFQGNFHEILHLCDMKGMNFGINVDDHKVKAIDLDMALFNTRLVSQYEQTNCSDDVECHFFDCKGLCLPEEKRCAPLRTNTNLEALCKKIFVGGILENGYLGLLSYPPSFMKDELIQALNLCLNQEHLIEWIKMILDRCQSNDNVNQKQEEMNSLFSKDCINILNDFRTFQTNHFFFIHKRLKDILSKCILVLP